MSENNPYQAPQSDLKIATAPLPKSIRMVLQLLGLSLLLDGLSLVSVNVGNDADIWLVSAILYVVWFGVISWIGWRIKNGRNEQWTMLILALMIIAIAISNMAITLSLFLDIATGLCFVGCFILLRQPQAQAWFMHVHDTAQ